MDNIKEWTFLPMPELITMASYSKKKKKREKRISSETSLISPNNPVGQGVKGLS